MAAVKPDGSDFLQIVEPGSSRDQPHAGTETPRWTADGSIVFSSNRAGGPDDWHLYVVDGEGGEPVQRTRGADGIEYHGVLSADEATFVYAKAIATPDGPDPYRDAGIFLSDADGGNERQLTTGPDGGLDEHPDISPDGTRIVFTRHFGGPPGGARSSIFVVNKDGTGLQELTDPELNAIRPRWSPDGLSIAFSSNADNFEAESANVWVVAADGTGLRQLTFRSGRSQAFFPDWSPDGRHLVYLDHREGSGTQDLAIIGLDGGEACVLWRGTTSLLAGDPDWGRRSVVR